MRLLGHIPGRVAALPALAAWILAAPCLHGEVQAVAMADKPVASSFVGMEQAVQVELPAADYQPVAADDRAPFRVRLADVVPAASGLFRYDLRITGFEAGSYRLSDHLLRPDGSRSDDVSAVVEVYGLLPADHDGSLVSHEPGRPPFVGGYCFTITLVAAVWLAGTVGWWIKRWPAPALSTTEESHEPTWEERIRPLVEAAAAGTITTAGKARLESLLVGFWRERLGGTTPGTVKEELTRLRAHPEACELIRSLERWLHQRGGSTREDVARLLEPYRFDHPSPAGKENAK